MAGLTEVPVIIMELDDKKAAQVAIIENVQREDLNPMEEATAYSSLIKDFDMTQEELSRQIGKSRSAIANTLRLLDLPPSVSALVKNGALSAGHARALLALRSSEDIEAAAKKIIAKNLSVRDTEALVRKLNRAATEQKTENEPFVDYTAVLAKKMTSRLGRKVVISGKGKNRRLEISFSDDKELDELVNKLCGENVFDD